MISSKLSFHIFAFLILSLISCTNRSFLYERNFDGITFVRDSVQKRIQFFDNHIVRVSTVKNGQDFIDSSLVINTQSKEVVFTLKNEKDHLILKNPALSLKVDKKSGTISFLKPDGTPFLREHEKIPSVLNDTTVLDSSYLSIRQAFQLTETEGIYGLGQFQNGWMNYRGKDLKLVQANKIAVVPLMVSTNQYGILWDNYSHTDFHDGKEGTWFSSQLADQIDYYFISGENMDSIISGYRRLTGSAPLFSKKAYGYWQSKERYKSFDELKEVVKKYRANKLPLDNIIQDWRYWGDNDHWSSMYFDPASFPNPVLNIQQLHDEHVDFMVSIWPAVGFKTQVFKDLKSKNLLFSPKHWSGGQVYDAFNEEAREIYWQHLREGLIDMGVDAFWMDGTEPEFSNTDTQKNTESGILNIERTAIGPASKFLNVYALATSEGLYQRHRAHTDKKRVFILTRSSWAGQQRNATVTWSGDVSANFTNLKKQITAGINFSMAGIPYWTHDIGAFFTSGRGGLYPSGIDDPAYQELYVRWFQFGAFTPIFRSHGTETPREVWQFKNRNPAYYQALKKTLELRYQLLPYIYANAWQVTNNDYTLMRGLPMDFSEDTAVYNIGDQYLFGSSFLVKPVTKEMYYRAKQFPVLIEGAVILNNENNEGIQATFFKDRNLKEPGVELKTGRIDYNWRGGGLPAGIPEENFSARWEFQLKPTESGLHKIVTEVNDGVRIWLNGQLIMDAWKEQSTTLYESTINLEQDQVYDVKVEFFQATYAAMIRLGWETPSYSLKMSALDLLDSTYLPKNERWFDFWSNRIYDGGQIVSEEYPIDIFPLFVKSGSIIPMTPVQQYVGEKPDAPILLRVYAGKNGEFLFYEDEGNNYNYENGAFNTIKIIWDEERSLLEIGESKGDFTGFKKEKELRIQLLRPRHAGMDWRDLPTKILKYDGRALKVQF